jgi:serine/threonine protein kinase/Tol biopolymer transport system component
MLTNIGNYRVLRLLGQGAAARVYLGEHIHLQTRAAIKLLHSQGNLSASEKQEFLREAKMIANLQHQHIVRVLEFDFTPQGEPFLVMEYAEHGSLRQRHPRGTRLTPAEIYGYLEQIGSALAFIHQSGVVHADIKPENLLLNRQQQLLLGDFGIATLARQTAHLICGTPAYMAPEQIQLHPCAASDQYALASVTYEWLCGQTPFQGTQQELLMRQVLGAVPPPRQFAPTLAPEIEQVLLRALAKDPATRFPDVAAFVSAFARAAQISTTGAVPSSIATPPATPPSTPAPAQQPTQLAAPASGAAAIPVSGTATTILPPPAPVTPPAQEPTRSTRKRQGETLYTSNLEGGFVRALAWSPDGKTLAAGCDYQQIFTWDALTGENRRAFHLHEHQIRALAWSPKGRVLASACADQLIHLWEPDSASPRAILTYRGHAGSFTLGLACVVAWSPSGLLLASAGTDRTAQVWRASTGERICTCRGHTKDINALAWSPNGTRLATGSDDGSVRLWDAHSGQLLATFRSHPRVYALAWSPNGTHLASAGEGNRIAIWPASETTSAPDTFYLGHVRSVYALAWSPDGQSVASTGRDATVQIWRASDGAHQYTYREHTSSVLVLAWSPDGEYLASADEDEQVRVWQAQN